MLEKEEEYTKSAADIEEKNATTHKDAITLELGDIIQIDAPSNPDIHESTFLVLYLDNEKINIMHTVQFQMHVLKLDKDGNITDESIRSISLINRSDEKGYARQNGLYPKTWVDVHFGGEVPTIITGEITDLVEDMIEITTYPEIEIIYIDFAYQGIPEHLPIEKFVIRDKPASLEKISSLINIRDSLEEGETPDLEGREEASIEYLPTGETVISLPKDVKPDETFQETLHKIYLDANQIVYGEELEEIIQRVEIPEYQKRHGIEIQVNDILDQMLATVPNNKRTESVLNNIHLLIRRFRELRERFSKFDSHGNVFDLKLHGTYKPLVQQIIGLNRRLRWIMPVVASRRKLYTLDDPEGIQDIIPLNQTDVLAKEVEYADEYKSKIRGAESSPYMTYYQNLHTYFQPTEPPHSFENYLAPNQTIHTELEGVVQNLENFYSTVYENNNYARRRFVIDRYQLGQTMLRPTLSAVGKKVYIREPIQQNDKITIQSLITLPQPAIEYSKIDLDKTNILVKSDYSQKHLYQFRVLHERAKVFSQVIRQFNQNMDTEHWESEEAQTRLQNLVQEFVLDETLEQKPHKYRDYLESVLPSVSTTIDIMIQKYPTKLSLRDFVDVLEPFSIDSEDLVYTHYNKIRYYVKTNRIAFLKKIEERQHEIAYLRNVDYHVSISSNRIQDVLRENTELRNLFRTYYLHDDDAKKSTDSEKSYSDSLETLSRILLLDNAAFYTLLVQDLMISLVTPENLLEALHTTKQEEEDMNKSEKIKATDCARRVLTKRYTSLKDLQKDNATEDVYYDKEFDLTPYDWMKKYDDARKKYSANDLIDFLAENLIQKHDCPVSLSKEMAKALIQGKKQVQEGEFAILEIRPQPISSETEITEQLRAEIQRESDIRKIVHYYRRKGREWVRDETVDETAFIDTNTLFCNMDKMCFTNRKQGLCENVQDTEARMTAITQKQLMNEFGERFAISVDKLKKDVLQKIRKQALQLKGRARLDELHRYKYNYYAYELGKMAQDNTTAVSPYMGIRYQILGQEDFVKRQSDIIQFVTLFCRDPVSDWNENMFWYYCNETNVPLLPTFLYQLANAFISNAYSTKLSEICRIRGRVEDNRIVDRYSGYTIRYIDFVDEQGYDEAGFKIITGDVMEKDAGDVFLDMVAAKKTGDRIFENEVSEKVFKIYKAISFSLGIPLESIEDFIMQSAPEIIRRYVETRQNYERKSDALEKQNKKRPPPYDIYYDKTVIYTVAGLILVGIQTAIPPFKIHKTNPGCVRSFKGYPDNGGSAEDQSGLTYIACVLNKLKTSYAPWNSIKPIPLQILQNELRKNIDITITKQTFFLDMYAKKREYNVLYPDLDIPEAVSVQKWTHFMPPLKSFDVSKHLRGLSSDYKQELNDAQRTKTGKQNQLISMYKVKMNLFGASIIQAIDQVVRTKDVLLKTASNMGFVENGCCNDRNDPRVLDYFIQQNKDILVHAKMIEGWEGVLDEIRWRSRAPVLFHSTNTRVQYPVVPTEQTDTNIYLAFIHHLHLDKDTPIPEKLRSLMSEKPDGYQKQWNAMEKIEFLKNSGKRFTLGNLKQLMHIIHQENRMNMEKTQIRSGSVVNGLKDILKYFDDFYGLNEAGLDYVFRQRLHAVIEKYDPNAMVYEISSETVQLNKWLIRSNEQYLIRVGDFLEKHGNLSRNDFNQLQTMLANIHMWNLDPTRNENEIPLPGTDETSMYTVIQFMKNSVYYMTRVYPEIICNNHTNSTTVHKHWGLSSYHEQDISKFLKKYYEPLKKFKNNPILRRLLSDLQTKMIDLYLFLQNVPAFTPIHKMRKDGDEPSSQTFYSLFDKRTLYLIYTNVWYSVLYKYIEATENPDYIQLDVVEKRNIRRENIQEREDPFIIRSSVDQTDQYRAEYTNDLMEVQIISGELKDLQTNVAEMLLAFLNIDQQNKQSLDLSYKQLEKRTIRSKLREKKMITDYFRDMERDERRAEDMQKALKLGRWNVGLRAGLVNYDKDRYDEERQDLFDRLTNRVDLEEEDIAIEREVEDMEQDDEMAIQEMYDEEAEDIGGLDEDYRDGVYYNEDRDMD